MTSAYPTPLDTLTDQVRDLATDLGQWPSRNQVMKHCKVGAPKATAALDALKATGFTPEQATTSADPATVRRLHSVPVESDRPTPPTTEPAPAESALITESAVPQGDDEVAPVATPVPEPAEVESAPSVETPSGRGARVRSWPLLLLAVGAFVAIWGGWVGLGEKSGFGEIRLLPGIADSFVINSAITLPIGVEAYAAYALRVWLSGATRSARARSFARWSAIGSLVLGALGQVAYHLMEASGVDVAPWWITTFVSVLPVVVLGCGAALTHLIHDQGDDVEVTR